MKLLHDIRLLFHTCGKMETKTITFHRLDGTPMSHSLYGPLGSFRATIHHCPICDRYTVETYGPFGRGPHNGDAAWARKWWAEKRNVVTFIGLEPSEPNQPEPTDAVWTQHLG